MLINSDEKPNSKASTKGVAHLPVSIKTQERGSRSSRYHPNTILYSRLLITIKSIWIAKPLRGRGATKMEVLLYIKISSTVSLH